MPRLPHLLLSFVFYGLCSTAVAELVKVSNSGAALPASAPLGTAADEWACTYDSNTNLIWEVKTNDKSLRDLSWIYSWYNSSSPDGNSGLASGPINCASFGRCDTEKFTQDVNAQGLCGSRDWRLPSLNELKTLVACSSGKDANNACNIGSQRPTIDGSFFPNTVGGPGFYWSSSVLEGINISAMGVSFAQGDQFRAFKAYGFQIRLVRSGTPGQPNSVTPQPTDTYGGSGLTVSGQSTLARFLLTAAVNGQNGNNFNTSQKIDLVGNIKVVPADAGRVGSVYMVAQYNNTWYMKTPQGWVNWDFTIASLVSSSPAHTLSTLETFDIERQLSGLAGNFLLYVGYKVDSDIHYNAQSLIFNVTP